MPRSIRNTDHTLVHFLVVVGALKGRMKWFAMVLCIVLRVIGAHFVQISHINILVQIIYNGMDAILAFYKGLID